MWVVVKERIKKLNLMTLEKRRHRSDLIEKFKIINGCYNLQSDLFFTYEGQRRDHSKKLYKKSSRLIAYIWESTAINQFKNCLKRELQPETRSSP